jgi:uncharacterized membrane protein (DUF2068 family)
MLKTSRWCEYFEVLSEKEFNVVEIHAEIEEIMHRNGSKIVYLLVANLAIYYM